MVNKGNYEWGQLALIVAQYELRGFKVKRDVTLRKGGMRFDAIAHKGDPPETIIIELVNRQRDDNETLVKRAEAISREFAGRENVLVDIRYLDQPSERATYARERAVASLGKTGAAQHLGEILARRLKPLRLSEHDRLAAAGALLEDWALFAHTVRAFCAVRGIGSETDSVVSLYDNLLQRFQLVGAEQLTSDGAIKDLRELYESVEEALEGALIDVSDAEQLRFHLRTVRRQMKHVMT